jgi:hypothetical protein
MSTARLPTIGELLAEAARSLPEPFTRSALINWVRARRPDLAVPSISGHIQQVTAKAGEPEPSGRTPVLQRMDRGLYCRFRPAGDPNVVDVPSGRVVLIGSSGAMAASPGPAAAVFESPGFARARGHAARSGSPWFVLSAKHGLLDPGDVVGPFDLQLGDQPLGYRTAWGEWVAASLAVRLRLQDVVVEVHGGVDFAQPLRQPLARRGAALELSLPGQWHEPAEAALPEPREDDDAPARRPRHRLRDLLSRT